MEFTIDLWGTQAKNNYLVELILHTESMDSTERQYWLDLLPTMTEEYIKRLQDILETEKRLLEELDLKFTAEISTLNKKHLAEWQENINNS
jgi:hypothetical protein